MFNHSKGKNQFFMWCMHNVILSVAVSQSFEVPFYLFLFLMRLMIPTLDVLCEMGKWGREPKCPQKGCVYLMRCIFRIYNMTSNFNALHYRCSKLPFWKRLPVYSEKLSFKKSSFLYIKIVYFIKLRMIFWG